MPGRQGPRPDGTCPTATLSNPHPWTPGRRRRPQRPTLRLGRTSRPGPTRRRTTRRPGPTRRPDRAAPGTGTAIGAGKAPPGTAGGRAARAGGSRGGCRVAAAPGRDRRDHQRCRRGGGVRPVVPTPVDGQRRGHLPPSGAGLRLGTPVPPRHRPGASYTPWLAVVDGSHYVLKYTPLVPGLFALSLWVTGGYWAVFAVLATAFVVVTYLLAVELLGDRTVAAVAAVLAALSPLVIIQSGLLLPYLPTASCSSCSRCCWPAARSARSRRPKLFAGAGLAAGLALTVRPFDGVLFVVPVLAWALFGPLRRTGHAGAPAPVGRRGGAPRAGPRGLELGRDRQPHAPAVRPAGEARCPGLRHPQALPHRQPARLPARGRVVRRRRAPSPARAVDVRRRRPSGVGDRGARPAARPCARGRAVRRRAAAQRRVPVLLGGLERCEELGRHQLRRPVLRTGGARAARPGRRRGLVDVFRWRPRSGSPRQPDAWR